jgi:hypothetical protein
VTSDGLTGLATPTETVNMRWIVLHRIEQTARTPGTSTWRGSFLTAALAWANRNRARHLPWCLVHAVELSSCQGQTDQ